MKIHPVATLEKRLSEIGAEASRLGLRAFVVGGIVRDWLMGRLSWDLDIVTEGDPGSLVESLAKLWNGRVLKHGAFTTYVLTLPDKKHLDFACAREESYPEPAALPVVQPSTMEKDLFRRDFTINAMAIKLTQNWVENLLDPCDGQTDLRKKLVRALHSQSFQDDPTRIYRAARFAGRLKFQVEPETLHWIKSSVAGDFPARLSSERLREELLAILTESQGGRALDLLRKWGALKFFHPDLRWSKKVTSGLSPLGVLGVLIHAWPEPKAVEFLARMKIASSDQEAILLAAHLYRHPEPRRSLAPLTKEILGALWEKKAAGLLKRIEIQPLLGGVELKELGFGQGPGIGTILQALLKAQFQGRLKTKDQARRFVIDNFTSD